MDLFYHSSRICESLETIKGLQVYLTSNFTASFKITINIYDTSFFLFLLYTYDIMRIDTYLRIKKEIYHGTSINRNRYTRRLS